jgi:hypothetical protein
VYILSATLTLFRAPVGSLYVSVMGSIIVIPALAISGGYYVVFKDRAWLVAGITITALNAAILSYTLIFIANVDKSVEGSIIVRNAPSIAPVHDIGSIVATTLLLSLIANAIFWAAVRRGRKARAKTTK